MSDEQLTQTMHASMPLTQTLGVEALAAAAEEVRARLPWRPELCTAGGLMHGGALMALADSAGGFCAFLNLPEGAKGTATIESKTNMLRGLTEGGATATARPLHVGSRTIVIETEVAGDDDGRLVAKTTQTQAVLT